MKILVTGGAGYLGSQLLPKLILRGHQIRVIDLGYFGVGHLRSLQPAPEMIREDLRRIKEDDEFTRNLMDGCQAVIHLAAMSNDPTADLDPVYTDDINTETTIALARAAKRQNAAFLFSSSCSVYGAGGELLDENGRLAPITTYALSKMRAEEGLLALADSRWKPTILRYGTLFGYSPRMRFDLVVNTFALCTMQQHELKVFGSGRHRRPFLHVKDCARAIIHFCEKRDLQQMVYNIAHENLQVLDVAEIFKRLVPALHIRKIAMENEDARDYQVTTKRAEAEGYRPRLTVEMGAEEMLEALVTGAVPDPESIFYQNIKWLKELGFKQNPHQLKRAA